MDDVRARFEALPEGGTLQIALTQTVPGVTTQHLQKVLYADVLGECTTSIGGTANRLSNVVTAAHALNGVTLAPGAVFSYNDTLGPRTEARGYKAAPAYVGGKTVDEVGGGICQNSSTLYLAALRADLAIVERTNHMYAVGYVPDGLDATVAYNALDFKFCNDTGYPIRLEVTVSGRTLLVRIHGTKTQNTTVKMETQRLSTTEYKTVYKPDSSVAAGKTVVDTTPYTGRKVQVYRCVYDSAGKLLSRTLESTNTYRHRDQVIRYNPADAARLGLVGADGKVYETVQPKPDTPVTPTEPEPTVPDTPVTPMEPEQTDPAPAEPDEPVVEQPSTPEQTPAEPDVDAGADAPEQTGEEEQTNADTAAEPEAGG